MSDYLDWATIRAVVFDVDGTLYDSRRMRRAMGLEIVRWLALRPWRLPEILKLRTFRRVREELADTEANQIGQRQYRTAAKACRTSETEIRRIVEEWIHRRPLPHLRELRLPGIHELFSELAHSGREIAAWSDYAAAEKLSALELYPDLIVSAEDPNIDRMKPNPAGLEHILGEFHLRPTECLMIGDRDDRDGEAARRLGVPYRLYTAAPASGANSFDSYFSVLATLRQR